MSVEMIKEMFEQMVLKKDPAAIARFYAPDFELHSNGVVRGFEEFAEGHRQVYASEITYGVEYDDDAVSEAQRIGCMSHVDESDIP